MNGYNIAHGLPIDLRIAIVSKKSNINKGIIIAIWISLLDFASQVDPRGSIKGIDIEEIAINLEIDLKKVELAISYFKSKKMIEKNDFLNHWKKSQKLSSTMRTRAFRARKKAEEKKQIAVNNRKESEEEIIKRRIRLQNQMQAKYKAKGKTTTI